MAGIVDHVLRNRGPLAPESVDHLGRNTHERTGCGKAAAKSNISAAQGLTNPESSALLDNAQAEQRCDRVNRWKNSNPKQRWLAAALPDIELRLSGGYSATAALCAQRERVLVAAYAKGARIIEKHFTHDKSLPGNDHYHAMDVHDLRRFVDGLGVGVPAMGRTEKAVLDSEAPARANARRSIVLARAVKAGDLIDEDAMTYKRPGTGISPSEWDMVIGRRAALDMESDHVLQWDDLRPENER